MKLIIKQGFPYSPHVIIPWGLLACLSIDNWWLCIMTWICKLDNWSFRPKSRNHFLYIYWLVSVVNWVFQNRLGLVILLFYTHVWCDAYFCFFGPNDAIWSQTCGMSRLHALDALMWSVACRTPPAPSISNPLGHILYTPVGKAGQSSTQLTVLHVPIVASPQQGE